MQTEKAILKESSSQTKDARVDEDTLDLKDAEAYSPADKVTTRSKRNSCKENIKASLAKLSPEECLNRRWILHMKEAELYQLAARTQAPTLSLHKGRFKCDAYYNCIECWRKKKTGEQILVWSPKPSVLVRICPECGKRLEILQTRKVTFTDIGMRRHTLYHVFLQPRMRCTSPRCNYCKEHRAREVLNLGLLRTISL